MKAGTSMNWSWACALFDDLKPTPGRLNRTLRIVLVSVLTLIIIMTFRLPSISLGMYFMFLVDREEPSASLRSSGYTLLSISAAVALELLVVKLSDNDPLARFVSVIVVTFLAGVLISSASVPTVGARFGFIYCNLIALWDLHRPADENVRDSLWLL